MNRQHEHQRRHHRLEAYATFQLPFGLALLTKECCPLGLDDADDGCLFAAWAGFAFAVINAVFVLITARVVEGVAIGSVRKRRALVLDRQGKDFEHVLMDQRPAFLADSIAAGLRVNASQV